MRHILMMILAAASLALLAQPAHGQSSEQAKEQSKQTAEQAREELKAKREALREK